MKTISYGYSFTFGHLGTIIGLIWLPMVVVAVAGYFVMSQYYGTFPTAMEQGNPAAAGQSALLVLFWSIASLLISSVMYAAVTRQALGLKHGTTLINFTFGVMELRVFAAIAALLAILFFFMLIYALAVWASAALAASLVSAGGKEIGDLIGGILVIVFFLGMIYALVRLSFLLIPATVSEGKVGLAQSWKLTKGNFWRIFLIAIATLGPLLLVTLAVEVAILGPDFFMPKGAASADFDKNMQQMIAQMRATSPHLPWLYGFSFLIAPVFLGLGLAPSAFAYRALTQKDDMH
ncbi:MAG TPA: hypothetical protein VGT78_11260 [Rhizomicrobium sp.]|nr:hypothetical protein [Rhizomicrobium sp.]